MTIDEKTKVPIVLVIGAIPILIGFMAWMSSVESKAEAGIRAEDEIKSVKSLLLDVRERVIRIETKQKTKRGEL